MRNRWRILIHWLAGPEIKRENLREPIYPAWLRFYMSAVLMTLLLPVENESDILENWDAIASNESGHFKSVLMETTSEQMGEYAALNNGFYECLAVTRIHWKACIDFALLNICIKSICSRRIRIFSFIIPVSILGNIMISTTSINNKQIRLKWNIHKNVFTFRSQFLLCLTIWWYSPDWLRSIEPSAIWNARSTDQMLIRKEPIHYLFVNFAHNTDNDIKSLWNVL